MEAIILRSFRKELKASAHYATSFLKWVLLAGLVGALGGVFGSIFHITIDLVTELRGEQGWLLYLLPLGGLLIVWLYRTFHANKGVDTNLVLESVRSEKHVPFVMAPLIFIGTVVTHMLGGSAGREGAALQLGGSIGYQVGKLLRLKPDDLHIIVMSGMSAVFAAMFGTPLTAAIFALEVISVGVMFYAGLVPCLVSSMVGYWISTRFGISPVRFAMVVPQSLSFATMAKSIALALLCALVSILFCVAIHKCEHYFKTFVPNAYLRVVIGAALIVGFTLLLGTTDYNGAGMDVIKHAMSGDARPEAFLIKIIFTAITIAAGFKGGEIVPAFFVGSTFGCVVGPLLGLDPGFAAAIGLVSLFCGVVNCPVASIMLAFELFGPESILIFAMVCGVSYMMSGNFSLYHSQVIKYSKLETRCIDELAH